MKHYLLLMVTQMAIKSQICFQFGREFFGKKQARPIKINPLSPLWWLVYGFPVAVRFPEASSIVSEQK
jgi:hypothetical protein